MIWKDVKGGVSKHFGPKNHTRKIDNIDQHFGL